MAERVRYRTKQQELVRECLKKHSGRFLTAEQCMDCLKADGLHVGQTTVYRALDHFCQLGYIRRDGAQLHILDAQGLLDWREPEA